MKEKIVNYIKKSSIFLLMLIINILVVTSLLFLVKVSITKYHLPIIYILSIIEFCFFYKKEKIKDNIIAMIISTVIFAVSIGIIGNVYDVTADGNTYHKLAIGCMKNGWNPSYEDCKDFSKNNEQFDISDDNVNSLWIDHYAKGTETIAAVIYAFTNNIETGKVYTVLMMYIVFGIALSYLNKEKKINLLASFVLAAIVVVNPITIVQSFNYYVDATLMLSLFLIFYTCIRIAKKEEYDKKEIFYILASGIIICINAKFTGLAFAGIFCFVFYAYWLYNSFKNKTLKEDFKLYTIFYVIVVLVSLLIVGNSSYTRNMIDHGHPLYPLYGEGHVDNMVVMEQPSSFENKNHIEIFLISIFAKGENVSPSYSAENNQPDLKIPFTFSTEEINNYSIPDIRMAGFGPLFSGIIILSLIVIVLMYIKLIKNKQWTSVISYSILFAIMAVLLIILDGNYWARYIPYIYAIPLIALMYIFEELNKKWRLVAGVIITMLMIINSLMILKVTALHYYKNSKYIGSKLGEFKEYASQSESVDIKLNHMGLQGVLYNLDDLNIKNYNVTNNEELNKEGFFFRY